MPKNALRVQRNEDGTFAVTVWGPGGAAHDLTPMFQEITGPAIPSLFTHRIVLQNGSFQTAIEFKAPTMDLRFDLEEEVARQLKLIAGG